MLPLHDTQVRLVLLNHVTLRLVDARPDELDAVGMIRSCFGLKNHYKSMGYRSLSTIRDTSSIG